MISKTVPDLETIKGMLDEVEEYAGEVSASRRRLQKHEPGSAAYHDLLPELSVQLDVLRLKAEHASEALDQYMDSLPDNGP